VQVDGAQLGLALFGPKSAPAGDDLTGRHSDRLFGRPPGLVRSTACNCSPVFGHGAIGGLDVHHRIVGQTKLVAATRRGEDFASASSS